MQGFDSDFLDKNDFTTGRFVPIGEPQDITGLNTAKAITWPDGAGGALVQVFAQSVYVEFDGNTPTSNSFVKAPADGVFYVSRQSSPRFLEAAASARLHVQTIR